MRFATLRAQLLRLAALQRVLAPAKLHRRPPASILFPSVARRQPTATAWRQAAAAMSSAAPRQPEAPEALPADFDKDQFKHTINVKALKIPTKQCHHYMKLLQKHLLNKPRLKNVQEIPGDDTTRLLLLEEGLAPESFAERDVAQPKNSDTAYPPTLQALIDADSLAVADAAVELGYDDLTVADALRRLLPADVDVPSSFEQVGHIAHLNLRTEQLPWRKVIGAVLADKNPKVRTVINKLGTIENEWRVFDMEVLAGEDDTVAEVRQHGARFRLDFKKVYWNSRLEAEHKRLVEAWFMPGQVVVDAMAGVGPFAVPAAQRGCRVAANDLNPDSHTWLVENIKVNKVGHAVCPFNLDGRAFMAAAAGGRLTVRWAPPPAPSKRKKKKKAGDEAGEGKEEEDKAEAPPPPPAEPTEEALPPFHHLVMNLPATAVEFLDALHGAFDPGMWADTELPTVHVYAFLKKGETTADLQRRIETALGGPLDTEPTFFSVRDVAPNKQMYCASFRVPKAVAFAEKSDAEAKRQRVD